MTIDLDTAASIHTAKGGCTDTLAECIAWQCEMQGAFAVIEIDGIDVVDVDAVDFDSDEIEATEAAVIAAVEAEMA